VLEPDRLRVPPTIAGHAFVQNARRGHYELAVDASASRRMTAAFGELATEM
jgi:hypothetical protein